jgi:dTDP-glucose pyrophosphorylase
MKIIDKNFDNLIITEKETIKDALIKINENYHKCLIVINNKRILKGTITDGNIRRGLLKGFKLTDSVLKISNKKKIIFLRESKYSLKEAKKKLVQNKQFTYIGILPIINNKNEIIDLLTKNDFNLNKNINQEFSKNTVVIMAGGKGIRLKPFTEVLPKPLIPIGNKTALEHIIDNFFDKGFNKFLISVNFKSKLIKAYLEELKSEKKIKINFIEEKKPLGTSGSLSLIKKKINTDIFVINCDTILKVDFDEILNFHKIQKNYITVVASLKSIEVPYGVFQSKKNGDLTKIIEKPKKNYLVNTGFYIIKDKVLKIMPTNKKIDFNELINLVKKKKLKIGIYPIEDKKWVDVGQWSEIKKINYEKNEIL